jgi:transcriptional regulator with XRE-family HTH domain
MLQVMFWLQFYSFKLYLSSTVLHRSPKTHGMVGTKMPQRSRLKLPPLPPSDETVGQRLARLRKAAGYTQKQMAEKMGLIQALISEYERDKMRLHAEMVIRFAKALGVSTDEILGFKPDRQQDMKNPSLKIVRRLNRISALPASKQKAFLQTIDALLKVQGE